MKTMFDTSVLVGALLADHVHFPLASPWLRRAHAGEFPWFIAAHSLAECYATLTAKSKNLSVPPAAALEMMRQNLTTRATAIIELSAVDYESSIQNVVSLGLSSGVIYDAILIAAAQKAEVGRLLTFNLKHFLQVWPNSGGIITSP